MNTHGLDQNEELVALFNHSFNKYLLRPYYSTDPELNARNTRRRKVGTSIVDAIYILVREGNIKYFNIF